MTPTSPSSRHPVSVREELRRLQASSQVPSSRGPGRRGTLQDVETIAARGFERAEAAIQAVHQAQPATIRGAQQDEQVATRFRDLAEEVEGVARVLGESGRHFESPPPPSAYPDSEDEELPTRFRRPAPKPTTSVMPPKEVRAFKDLKQRRGLSLFDDSIRSFTMSPDGGAPPLVYADPANMQPVSQIEEVRYPSRAGPASGYTSSANSSEMSDNINPVATSYHRANANVIHSNVLQPGFNPLRSPVVFSPAAIAHTMPFQSRSAPLAAPKPKPMPLSGTTPSFSRRQTQYASDDDSENEPQPQSAHYDDERYFSLYQQQTPPIAPSAPISSRSPPGRMVYPDDGDETEEDPFQPYIAPSRPAMPRTSAPPSAYVQESPVAKSQQRYNQIGEILPQQERNTPNSPPQASSSYRSSHYRDKSLTRSTPSFPISDSDSDHNEDDVARLPQAVAAGEYPSDDDENDPYRQPRQTERPPRTVVGSSPQYGGRPTQLDSRSFATHPTHSRVNAPTPSLMYGTNGGPLVIPANSALPTYGGNSGTTQMSLRQGRRMGRY